MIPKQLFCMDEEISLEIAKPNPEDTTNDLVITISFTRTYVFTDSGGIQPTNGNSTNADALNEYHALVL